MAYQYELSDLKHVVKTPPSFVKITRVPRNGNLIVKKLGEWIALREGDLIETDMLNSFVYDQGDEVCTINNKDRCDDQFSYIPYGEWTGRGEYQST